MRKTWLVAAGLLAGCSSTTENPRSCLDGYCSEAAYPFCDTDGSIGGTKFECVAVACTAGEPAGCTGDTELTCNPTGTSYDSRSCEFGCNDETGLCHPCNPADSGCSARLIPKYLPTVCESFAGSPALTLSESRVINTDDEPTCNGGVVPQANAPDICVLRYGRITIAQTANIIATGSRALALVADGPLEVLGVLDVGAHDAGTTRRDGPGGGYTRYQSAATSPDANGGAGFRTAGGPGGSATADGGANNGGPTVASPALRGELIGGVGTNATAGGAATLISCRDGVRVTGLIDAGGGGGDPAFTILETTYVATGGGSGGLVAFQGLRVEITGELYANGGGGGAGIALSVGTRGENGTRSVVDAAQGGTAVGTDPGNGGMGGVATIPPGPGKRGLSGSTAGAGGGSVGFFYTFTPENVTPLVAPRAASPAVEPNRSLPTRGN